MLIRSVPTILFALSLFSFPVFAGSTAEEDKSALEAFMVSDEVSEVNKTAYGYAIFPTIGKGGIGIGGAYGDGSVYKQGKKTGDTSMAQLSIGFQLGGQAYRQVVYFEDKRAFDDFTSGNFEFGAQAQAVFVESDASASASSEGTTSNANADQGAAKYHKGMMVFIMGKGGLMFQAALGGQKYSYTPLK